jgi:hypothetical protein
VDLQLGRLGLGFGRLPPIVEPLDNCRVIVYCASGAIYCTLVMWDTLMVSLRYTLVFEQQWR